MRGCAERGIAPGGCIEMSEHDFGMIAGKMAAASVNA